MPSVSSNLYEIKLAAVENIHQIAIRNALWIVWYQFLLDLTYTLIPSVRLQSKTRNSESSSKTHLICQSLWGKAFWQRHLLIIDTSFRSRNLKLMIAVGRMSEVVLGHDGQQVLPCQGVHQEFQTHLWTRSRRVSVRPYLSGRQESIWIRTLHKYPQENKGLIGHKSVMRQLINLAFNNIMNKIHSFRPFSSFHVSMSEPTFQFESQMGQRFNTDTVNW